MIRLSATYNCLKAGATRAAVLLGLMLVVSQAQAAVTTASMKTWTDVSATDGNAAAQGMLNTNESSVAGVVGIIIGLGFWITIGIGCIMVLIGWFKGIKDILFIGICCFIIAAIMRGAMTLLL